MHSYIATRQCRVAFSILPQRWWTHCENETIVSVSGSIMQEEYLRQLVRGVVPRDALPPDYYKMMRQLYHIGNSLNQIAKKAHVLNVMDVKRYDEAVSEFEQALKRITEAVILPAEK